MSPSGRCPWSRSAAVGILGRDIPAPALSGRLILVGLTIWDHERVSRRARPFSRISLYEAEQDAGTT